MAAGNFLVDLVKVVDHWPEQDALALILSETRGNGGGPYNVLKDLARLGAPFPLAAAGLVGDDEHGRYIIDDLRGEGIDVGRLAVTREVPTSYTDVMSVQGTGRRTFFHRLGANARFAMRELEPADGRKLRWLHYAYLFLLEEMDAVDGAGRTGASRLLESAVAAGVATSVDLVSVAHPQARSILAASAPFIDVLFLNEFETACVTGVDLLEGGRISPGAAREASRVLFELGIRRWAIFHAATGAVACAREGRMHGQDAVRLPREQIRGATGAGDAFCAGVVLGMHESWPIERCLETGVCVAAACLTHETASNGVGPLDVCMELGFRQDFACAKS